MSPKAKKAETDFVDELIDEAASLFGLLDGDVDDGKKEEAESGSDNDDGSDDDSTEPGRKAPAGKAKGKQDPKPVIHEFRHVFTSAGTGGAKRGRPKGPASGKKKPDDEDGAAP